MTKIYIFIPPVEQDAPTLEIHDINIVSIYDVNLAGNVNEKENENDDISIDVSSFEQQNEQNNKQSNDMLHTMQYLKEYGFF